MTAFAAILLFALSRAEFIQRMQAPAITQADGLVKVYAMCPEDMRVEYQMPIASFAAETVKKLYQGRMLKPRRFVKPGIVINIGDVRTNLTAVAAKVATNDAVVVTRIYVPSPGSADIAALRTEIVKGFARAVLAEELSDADAISLYRRCDPYLRIKDQRDKLERWLAAGEGDDEEALALMHRVIEPGRAAPRDIAIFASRLFLYPSSFDQSFMGLYKSISFKDSVKFAKIDPRIRLAALTKADSVIIFGGGRGEPMSRAAQAYSDFLRELAMLEKDEDELLTMLEAADALLREALAVAEGRRKE